MTVKTYRIFIALWAAVILCAGGAHARKPPFAMQETEDLPVDITAVQLNYDKKKDLLVATGAVEITQGNRILKADNVTINLITKDTEARGNVELFEGGDVLNCDAFNINLDTQVGVVSGAKIFIKEQNFHIEGTEVKKLGLNTYAIENGRITTCDGRNPAWRIEAGTIDVTVDGYARARHSTFRLKGLPVLYLPFAVFPLKVSRQTGFLYPELGHSKRLGFAMGNSFFWALSENTDATFWLDTTTKKGLGGGTEYRFKLADDTWGKLYTYFTYEKSDYFEDEYRSPRDRDQLRGYMNFEGEHYFDSDCYIKAQGSYITDREFYHDYKRVVNRSSTETSNTNIKTKEKDESVIFFNKNWDFSNLLINYNFYKNLQQHDPQTLQRLPQVVFSSMQQPLWLTPFYYRLDASYDFLWREEGQKGHRLDVFPQVSWPVTYDGWLKLNPTIGLRGMTHFGLHQRDGLDEEGVFPSAQIELSTTIIRVFNTNGERLAKLKHTVEPGLLYEYIPSNDQTDFPSFDIPDRFYRRHTVGYYVKNRFTGLLLDATGNLNEHEIGYFMIGQSFNIMPPKGGLYLQGDPEDDFSDLFAEFRVGIFPELYAKAKFFYNPYDNSLRSYNCLLNWSNQRGEYLELEYRYARRLFEILDLEGRLRLTRQFYVFFDTRYDYLESEDLDTEIGIDYSAQCWGARLSLEASGDSGGVASDVSFNFMLYLKGLGGTI